MEGAWGSGKSSLLNLIARALADLPNATRPVVVEFKPWLIGDRDALLGSFFSQMAIQIEAVEKQGGHSSMADTRNRKELVEHLRGYAASAEVFGSILSALPGAGFFGTVIKQIAGAAKRGGTKTPLIEQKRQIDASLSKLARRIVVMIDDVDRLEPREVIELLRLIRSVADFKNVIYLLCYDEDVLSSSIQASVQVPNGHSYLEKIVQVGVTVPIPEPFQLRRWFESDLGKILWDIGEEDQERLRRVVDTEGGRRLATPRHVVRLLNALHLLVPALRDEIDLADLVWLQMVKTNNHKLYRWIESYCANASAASSSRVTMNDDVKIKTFAELEKLLEADGLTYKSYRYELAEHLPGLSSGMFGNSDTNPIFNKVERRDLETAIRGRRLASPDHYRLYFALALPSTAPRTRDFDDLFTAAAASPGAVSDIFRTWMMVTDPTIGSKANLMLERLKQGGIASLSPEQCAHIVLGLADVMDEAAAIGDLSDFGSASLWRQAEWTMLGLLQGVGLDRRRDVILKAFGDGRALGWLTSLLRHEIFGHGRFGRRQREDESKWLLSDEELDLVILRMTSRYEVMSLDEFVILPNAVSALFAWSQSGHEKAARAYVGRAAETDEGLIRILEIFANLVRSTGGNYNVLRRENIDPFLDYDMVRERVKKISQTTDVNLKARAEKLQRFLDDAERF